MTEDMSCLVRTPISLEEVIAMAQRRFGDMAKAAVDVRRGVMAIGAMINVRPSANNRTRGVDDPAMQARIREVVHSLITR